MLSWLLTSLLVGSEVEGIDVCHLLGKHVNMLLCRLPESTSVCEFSASLSLLLEAVFGLITEFPFLLLQ